MKKKYRLVVMNTKGETFFGRTYNDWDDIHNTMIELRMLYAKHEVTHRVGYMEMYELENA